jgi:hypothetical protein
MQENRIRKNGLYIRVWSKEMMIYTSLHILYGTLGKRNKTKYLNFGRVFKVFNTFTVKRRKVADKTEDPLLCIGLYVHEWWISYTVFIYTLS